MGNLTMGDSAYLFENQTGPWEAERGTRKPQNISGLVGIVPISKGGEK